MIFGKNKVYSKHNTLAYFWGLKKYKFESLGINVRICMPGYLACTENITIGDNVFIGRDFYIEAQSKITIGAGTMIGPRCTFISGSHYFDGPDLKAVPYDNKMKNSPIIIKNNVWIAANVNISPGTIIGEGSVIGSGTCVYGEIPPYSVVVNSGYKIMKERDKKAYKELVKSDAIYNILFAGKGFEYIDE